MPFGPERSTPPETVAAARCRLLRDTTPVSVLSNASAALIATGLLHGNLPPGQFWVWCAVMLGLQSLRLLLWLVLRRGPPSPRNLVLSRLGYWLTGALWGTVPVLLFPADTQAQSFVAFILAGVSGAVVAGLAFDAWVSGVFVALVILPLALRLALTYSALTSALGVLVVLYMLYLGMIIRRGQVQFLQLLDWRTRADAARQRAARQAQLNALLAEVNQIGATAVSEVALYAAVCRAVAAQPGLGAVRVVQRAADAASFETLAAGSASASSDGCDTPACDTAWRQDTPQFLQQDGAVAACLPLHTQGRVCALLRMDRVRADAFDDVLRDWLLNLAASVDRGLLAVGQRARIDRLQNLYRALIREGEVVLQARSAEEMLQRTCDTLTADTQFHAACLARPDESGAFRVLARAGDGAEQLDHFRVHLADANRAPLVLQVWDTQALHYSNDLLQDDAMLPWRQSLARYRWHAALAVPVWRSGALWGVLVFTAPQPQAFDEQTMALCQQVAALLGYGLDELDVKERLSHLQRIEAHRARHDALTGLPNRYALEQYLPAVVERARKQGNAFAIGMIDLDGFKIINDTWGHSAGDRVLRELTRRLQAVRRQSDYLARLGGDEFVVVMEDLNPLEVHSRFAHSVERLRQAVAVPFDIAPNVQLPLEMSIGIASYPVDAQDADTLMRLADKAMYASKAARAAAAGR